VEGVKLGDVDKLPLPDLEGKALKLTNKLGEGYPENRGVLKRKECFKRVEVEGRMDTALQYTLASRFKKR